MLRDLRLSLHHLQSQRAWTPPASPNCFNHSMFPSTLVIPSPHLVIPSPHLVIPSKARNLLSSTALSCKRYRRTSIYYSAGTPASTCPPPATRKKSKPATSANPSSPPAI